MFAGPAPPIATPYGEKADGVCFLALETETNLMSVTAN